MQEYRIVGRWGQWGDVLSNAHQAELDLAFLEAGHPDDSFDMQIRYCTPWEGLDPVERAAEKRLVDAMADWLEAGLDPTGKEFAHQMGCTQEELDHTLDFVVSLVRGAMDERFQAPRVDADSFEH